MLLLLLGAAALVILLVFYHRAVQKRPDSREDLPAYLDGEIEHDRTARTEPE